MANIKRTELERIQAYEKKAKELREKIRRRKEQERYKTFSKVLDVMEELLGREFQENDIDKLKLFIQQQEQRGNFFTKAMNTEPGIK